MAGFVEGIERGQSTMFPARLDDYVSDDNPVRAVDAFVDGLDLGKLGFTGVQPLDTGRPGYFAGTMLKIYIYGYLNRIPSSRRIERGCQRNIELIWLTGKLAPDHKTIADFRKDNGKAIREACRAFVLLCRQLDLLSEASVAIDGSKFKAVNARDNNFTEAKMKRRLERIDESITRHMEQLVTADRQIAGGNDAVPQAKVERLKNKLAKLKEEVARLNAINEDLQRSEDKQISLTDPDSRSTVEHPFGTIKCWMGATHFLCTTLPKVATEMALNVLAYNMLRVINIMGVDKLLEAIRALTATARSIFARLRRHHGAFRRLQGAIWPRIVAIPQKNQFGGAIVPG